MSSTTTDIQNPAPSLEEKAGLVDRFDSLLNPVLVKDVRSWLRSKRFLSIFFLGMIAAQVVTVSCTLMSSEKNSIGSDLFYIIIIGMGFVLGGIIPFLIQDKFCDELQSKSTELSLISCMTSGQLVRGKIICGLAAALLFFSAIGPSLMLAYLLGGLDPFAAIYSMVLLIFFSAIAMLAAVVLAAAGGKRWSKILGFLLFVSGLALASFLGSMMEITRRENVFVQPEFYVINGLFLVLILLTCYFFYTCAVAKLSFQADNRDSWPRFSLTLLVLTMLGSISLVPWVMSTVSTHHSSSYFDAVEIAIYFSLAAFFIGFHFLLRTPVKPSERTISLWPRSRLRTLFYYPGRNRLTAYLGLHAVILMSACYFCDGDREMYQAATTVMVTFSTLGVGLFAYFIICSISKSLENRISMLVTVLAMEIIWLGISTFFWLLVTALNIGVHLEDWIAALGPATALFYIFDSPTSQNFKIILICLGPFFLLPLLMSARCGWQALQEGATFRRERIARMKEAGLLDNHQDEMILPATEEMTDSSVSDDIEPANSTDEDAEEGNNA